MHVIHSRSTTAANEHDVTQAKHLQHGDESRFWGDAGYQGIHKRPEFEGYDLAWNIAARPGQRRKLGELFDLLERHKAQVRAKVEHPFLRIKQQFGYSKVRYKGLGKNTNRLYLLAAFTNLLTCKKYLMA